MGEASEKPAAPCGCLACVCERRREAYALTSGYGMIVCPVCGNKRCPKATDHTNACTNSNEPGQPGSIYT